MDGPDTSNDNNSYGYLQQASSDRHTSLETQRLRARERVLQKMRDDAAGACVCAA